VTLLLVLSVMTNPQPTSNFILLVQKDSVLTRTSTKVTGLDIKSKFFFSPNVDNKVLSSKTVIMTAVPRPEMTCPACPHHRSEINYI